MKSPRMGYTMELRMEVGRALLIAPRGTLKLLAKSFRVTERTLNSWKRRAQADLTIRPGPTKKGITLREKLIIGREWKRQGFPGSRPVIAALPGIRVRAVRIVVEELKARRRKRRAQHKKRVQVRIRVNKPGTVLSADGATVQKGEDYIVYRDRGNLSVCTEPCISGVLATADTLAMLEKLKGLGRLPLVFTTDNGSPLCSNIVCNFLDNNFIIHLKSLPRVPQQNGSAENAVKEFKELIKEGYPPDEVSKILNERRKRRQLNYRTSQEFDQENFNRYTQDKRCEFYQATKLAIEEAQLGMKSVYQKRKAEREAILQTMVNFSLITKTRGGQLCSPKPEESL